MLSFLSLSNFITPSVAPSSLLSGNESRSGRLWRSLETLGFTKEVIEESNSVLDPSRWAEASHKLGEPLYYPEAGYEADTALGHGYQARRNSFVEIMQQFSESLLAELDALEQIELALPMLHRAVHQAKALPGMQQVARANIDTAEKLMLQYHALIPARLAEFREWAEAYDLLQEARQFFYDYTAIRQGNGTSLDALFIRFSVS